MMSFIRVDSLRAYERTVRLPHQETSIMHAILAALVIGLAANLPDTGAPALFVSPAVCEKLGIKANAQGWGKIPSFEIEGRVPLKDARARVETPFQLEGMNGLGLAG